MSSITIAVVSSRLYRAESLALAIGESLGRTILALTPGEIEKVAGCDIVLIEVESESNGNWELIHAVTERSNAKVILLGLVESEENIIRAVEARASGYIAATAGMEQLLNTVFSVCRGEFTYPEHFTYMLFEHLTFLARSDRLSERIPFDLSRHERKILELISQNLTNKEIAARLFISEYTAKNHVHRILKKLGARSRHYLSVSARGRLTFRTASSIRTRNGPM
jgi:two-component system, NarL family, nitrate/nitrite response regulator NarL